MELVYSKDMKTNSKDKHFKIYVQLLYTESYVKVNEAKVFNRCELQF